MNLLETEMIATDYGGETVTIEAATVEEALAQLADTVGPAAKIIGANRVRKGGVAGFFAKELIELVAEVTPPPTHGVNDAFARMLADAENPVVGAPPVAIQRVEPSIVLQAPPPPLVEPRAYGTRWGADTMLRAGMPTAIVNRLAHLDTGDDLGHVMTLASILTNLCTELPGGAHRVVAGSQTEAADLPVEHGDGPVHLVVGAEPFGTPPPATAIISWTSDAAAPQAIALALRTGAILGFGRRMQNGSAGHFGQAWYRIAPMDAVLTIRSLMVRS